MGALTECLAEVSACNRKGPKGLFLFVINLNKNNMKDLKKMVPIERDLYQRLIENQQLDKKRLTKKDWEIIDSLFDFLKNGLMY